MTPLLHAANVNSLRSGQLLLRANCSTDTTGKISLVGRFNFEYINPFQCAIKKRHWAFTVMLVHAGYDLSREHYLWTEECVPATLQENLPLLQWLKQCTRTPADLLVLARSCCRSRLRSPLVRYVPVLTQSPCLRKLLMMEDILPNSAEELETRLQHVLHQITILDMTPPEV